MKETLGKSIILSNVFMNNCWNIGSIIDGDCIFWLDGPSAPMLISTYQLKGLGPMLISTYQLKGLGPIGCTMRQILMNL